MHIYLLLLSLLLCSCGSHLVQRDELLVTYQYGNLTCAEQKLTHQIDSQLPNDDFRRSKDAVCLLLDRATIRLASGETDGSIHDYQLAIEALDYYNQDSPAEILAKTVLQDSVAAYQGAGFEQVLARLYFAVALLQQGDRNNAFAILRQGEELQQQLRERYASTSFTKDYQLTDNALMKYLFAAVLEKQGDISNAEILYRQSAELTAGPKANSSKEKATILVLCHNGNVPRKVSSISDGSVASAVALEYIFCTLNIPPAFSTMTGIPVPRLFQTPDSEPVPAIACCDGISHTLIPMYDIANTAYHNLQQEMPVIAARGVARLAMRRAAVAYAAERDPYLGLFADMGVLIANVSTEADIRAWSTLPSTIDLARYDIDAGVHTLSIQLPRFSQEFQIQLKPHDLCVINVFHIHPGVTSVLVPPQFLCPK